MLEVIVKFGRKVGEESESSPYESKGALPTAYVII